VYFFPAKDATYTKPNSDEIEIVSDLEVRYQQYLTDYGVKHLTV